MATLTLAAQTFEIGGQSSQPAESTTQKGSGKKKPAQVSDSGSGIGWGNSIEVGRLARAAEDALKKGNPSAAATYAERATQAAPQNAKLWFLLGYTSRLAGRYQTSIDAYKRGLQNDSSNVEGLSGMAQTYARMGRTDEAKRILMQILAANPRRETDLLVAGELFIQTGDLQKGVELLQRAESMKPSSHAELLMAIAYMKMKEPARAKQLLDQAKRRDPRNTDIFRAVANYYRETHDYDAAIATLKSAPKMGIDVLSDLAYSYELAGKKKEAADTYSKTANMAPKQLNLQLSAAQAEMNVGHLEESRKFLARAEGLDANHYRLHALRAALAKMENQPADAIREYNLALSHMPEGGVPEGQLYPVLLRLNLAELYRETGDEANAKTQVSIAESEINMIQADGPGKAEFLRARASLKTFDGDLPGAEKDLKEALQVDPANMNITLQYANLLWKMNRKEESRKLYTDVLAKEPNNRFGLEAMGYLYREDGDNKAAEEFFNRLAAAYPNDYVPYLALGDMFTATRDFARADQNYQKAYKLANTNSVVVANAANAAIEARQLPLAGEWLARAKGSMQNDPRVMLERERYLFHTGKYVESAQLGRKVLEKLPKDRNASVYLGYALYNLGRYDDVLSLSDKYEHILPKESNFPLLAGHVHKQSQLLDEAVDDYTRAIQRDPKMVEAYVNRGYVLNDMQDAQHATRDFDTALKLAPNNGTAHLGMAFSDLQLRHAKAALDQVDSAEKIMGESGATHLVRATAYRQQRSLLKAEKEYRAALKYAPDDFTLHTALADTLYHMRHYADSLAVLNDALALSPDDPLIYAEMAHAHAQLRHRDETMKYVKLAETQSGESSAVLLDTGDALLTLGDRNAAMQRFERALDAPDASRVDARIAIAKLMARDGRWDDAREQISLGFAESRIGEASPVTADNLVEAANLFLAMHDFDMATKLFQKAKDAGAADQVYAIGMANTFLAKGDPVQAQAALASMGNPADNEDNYDYMVARGNMYRQEHNSLGALSAFARANSIAGDDDLAERQMEDVAGEEGLRLNQKFSALSDLTISPIFDDTTIYITDARVFRPSSAALLPPPRMSLQTLWTNAFRYHQEGLPLISGFFQVRNATGQVSLPQQALILNRNTWDYNFNGALNPILHFGRNYMAFNTGLQFTVRRDTTSPIDMDQNLFRQFVYMSTNSLGNWLSVRGSAYHEAGPFTLMNLHSVDVGGSLEFTVGRPWGKTALLTGYTVRDLRFNPLVREYYATASYIGLQRKFGTKVTLSGVGQFVRAWRIQDQIFGNAESIRPAAELTIKPNNRWTVDTSFAMGRGQGFHTYDNIQSGFFISYVKPLRRMVNDGVSDIPVEYPLRFSFGIQQQDFYNFNGHGQSQISPVVRLTIF